MSPGSNRCCLLHMRSFSSTTRGVHKVPTLGSLVGDTILKQTRVLNSSVRSSCQL
uniref:Uncharacterized protein n=1 Tax=Xenopus tropicalis TaxID=8364 RepID=A0A1B8Y8P9_XENTR